MKLTNYRYDSISTQDDTCEGTSGYSDMTPGTAVTVQNAQGQIVATGALETGSGSGFSCTLPFSVPDVPDGLSEYSVTVSHRGTQVIPASEAHGGVSLTLGG